MNIPEIQKESESIYHMVSLLKQYCKNFSDTEELETINYGITSLSRHADKLCCLLNSTEI